jgi:hypothetical protein
MNHTLKLAMAAAVATLSLAGQAHALTNSSVGASGSLFLYAFEDRQANPAASNSAVFDLGLASVFDTSSNQTFDFSTNSAWTSYIATIATPANIHWGVFGVSNGTGGAGGAIVTTLSVVPASINGTALNSSIANYNQIINIYGTTCTSCGFNAVTNLDIASTAFDDNAGAIPATLTTGLDGTMNFYKYVSTGTKATSLSTQTAFATGGVADYFSLSSTGVLNYVATTTAPVPEANTYALMLAGLGLVGYTVRRRKSI